MGDGPEHGGGEGDAPSRRAPKAHRREIGEGPRPPPRAGTIAHQALPSTTDPDPAAIRRRKSHGAQSESQPSRERNSTISGSERLSLTTPARTAAPGIP
jgi:hypothetical protein